MKSYLINLDRSPERLEFFQRQAADADLAFERVSAVDGSEMEPGALQQSISPRFTFQPINQGEAALFLSHRLCWQQLIDSGEAWAAVFEDDAMLAGNGGEILKQLKSRDFTFDVIKLETTLRKVVLEREGDEVGSGFCLHRLLTWHGGTAAYAISRTGAEKLLAATMPLADPVDQVMFHPLHPVCAGLQIAQIVPGLAVQYDILKPEGDEVAFPSTIGRHGKRRRLFRHGPLIDFRRAWLKHKERGRRKSLARQVTNQQLVVEFAGG